LCRIKKKTHFLQKKKQCVKSPDPISAEILIQKFSRKISQKNRKKKFARNQKYDCDGDGFADVTCETPSECSIQAGFQQSSSAFAPSSMGAECGEGDTSSLRAELNGSRMR
jgi:hypothetical protein